MSLRLIGGADNDDKDSHIKKSSWYTNLDVEQKKVFLENKRKKVNSYQKLDVEQKKVFLENKRKKYKELDVNSYQKLDV